MSKGINGEVQPPPAKQAPSNEELRNRAKDALEKASRTGNV